MQSTMVAGTWGGWSQWAHSGQTEMSVGLGARPLTQPRTPAREICHPLLTLENSSQTYPDVGLHGDSESCQVDSQDQPLHASLCVSAVHSLAPEGRKEMLYSESNTNVVA